MLTNTNENNNDTIIRENYETICENLCINGTDVTEQSWNVYQTIKNDHNLEVSETQRTGMVAKSRGIVYQPTELSHRIYFEIKTTFSLI